MCLKAEEEEQKEPAGPSSELSAEIDPGSRFNCRGKANQTNC